MAAVAMGTFISTIDGSIVNVALPTLARELRAPFAAVQWVVLAYQLTLVTLLLSVGRLADMYGKRRLYVVGFMVFTLGSLGCALSPTVGWLVAARVLQAFGAALLMALGAAVAIGVFPPQERGRAMGLIGVMVSIGLVSGPTLGGLILGVASWQSIFLVNLPLGILGAIAVLRFVPHEPPPQRARFDIPGAALLFVGLLSFLLAVTLGPRESFRSPIVLGLTAVSALGLIAFLRHEARTVDPVIDLDLFRSSELSLNVLTGSLTFVASAGIVFLLPFFLQTLQGRSPREAGLLLAVSPLTMGLIAPVSGWLSDRVGPRPLTAAGLATLVVGYLLVSTLTVDTSTAGFVGRVFWLGFGMGLFQSPNNAAIMGSAPRHRLGVASGLMSLTRTLGQATGVALIGALWAGLVALMANTEGRDAMHAPIEIQLDALRWTLRAVALLLAGATVVTIGAWWRHHREVRVGASLTRQ